MDTDLTQSDLEEMYREMVLIRRFEDRLEVLYSEGLIPSSIHLYHGQEAIAVGAWRALTDDDMILTNHRPDGHIIASGVDLSATLAEFFGRQGGPCAGKGGSMHFCSAEDGFYGSNGVVGANLPHALGLAYADKFVDSDGIVVGSFGDGASNQGTFGESLNMSSLWDVPVLWCCENNRYAETTPIEDSTAGSIARRADGYDIENEVVDAMDVVNVYEAVEEYADIVRSGRPALLELQCYRFKGHSRADDSYGPDHYRDEEEVKGWHERDPIKGLADDLGLSDEDRESVRDDVDAEIDEAVEIAKDSPKQTPEELTIYE